MDMFPGAVVTGVHRVAPKQGERSSPGAPPRLGRGLVLPTGFGLRSLGSNIRTARGPDALLGIVLAVAIDGRKPIRIGDFAGEIFDLVQERDRHLAAAKTRV